MRKLASIQTISDLQPIEGADAIEVARVLGWNVVVKRGEFAVGDKIIYCELDSILPDRPEFEFLRPRGFRIKTIRLRGQVSQGICFPLTVLPDYELRCKILDDGFPVDEDVTDALGVEKYEPYVPAHLMGVQKGSFLSGLIPKTDETRVQVLQPLLDKYAGREFWVTEKVDGSSVTMYIDEDGAFNVCSRNTNLVETEDNAYWKAARELDVEKKLRFMNTLLSGDEPSERVSLALQGELVGPGIQSNRLKLEKVTIMIFNALEILTSRYASNRGVRVLCNNLGLTMVPTVEERFVMTNDVDALIAYATRKSLVNPKVWAEGVVFRPYDEVIDPSIDGLEHGRVSFKAINPEYLLKNE